jgi:hypothetical protein
MKSKKHTVDKKRLSKYSKSAEIHRTLEPELSFFNARNNKKFPRKLCNDSIRKTFKRNLKEFFKRKLRKFSKVEFAKNRGSDSFVYNVVKNTEKKYMNFKLGHLLSINYDTDRERIYKHMNVPKSNENIKELDKLLETRLIDLLKEYRRSTEFLSDALKSLKNDKEKKEAYFKMAYKYINHLNKTKAKLSELPDDVDEDLQFDNENQIKDSTNSATPHFSYAGMVNDQSNHSYFNKNSNYVSEKDESHDTTSRNGLIYEGSDDGNNFSNYKKSFSCIFSRKIPSNNLSEPSDIDSNF